MAHHVVAGALVGPQGVLLVRRHPHRQYYPDCWDFPGGHIELGESAADALARELREEIGVDATITGAPALRVVENETADDGLVLQLWIVTDWEGEPANLATDEHDELRWVDAQGVSALDLAHPSYRPFLAEWANGHRGERAAAGLDARASSRENHSMTGTQGMAEGDSSAPWQSLSSGYERARAREDSLDRLVEWPAQRELIGDVTGLSVLDAGCGNGEKIVQLADEGASVAVGVDISESFPSSRSGAELVQGDLSDLSAVPGLSGRPFDRILFLQSIGYAVDGVAALRTARDMLTDDGFLLVTRTQPVRYALERAEQNGTTLGEEYFSTEPFPYRHKAWDDGVTLTKTPYTMSDLLNMFSEAGLWIEKTVEPQMPVEAARRYPHKQAALDTHLGILMFKLRPRPAIHLRST